MKRIFTVLLIFCMVAAVFTGIVLAQEPTSGTCGENSTWTLSDGTLTISGTGVMDNYTTGEPAPWTYYKYDISAIVIEPGITVLGEYAFWECAAQSISLPDTLTHIGTGAFHSCRNLSSVTLPESLVSIGEEAFQYCDNLRDVYIPDSVTDIGRNAFYSCYTLERVAIPEGITQINMGTFAWCSSLCEVTLPSTLTTICEDAFIGCCGMSWIEVPYGVTYIGDSAFASCDILTDIYLPETLQEVGENVFSWCIGLEHITLPQGLTAVGWGMFSHCDSLTDVTIPDTVTTIGPFAFSQCYKLKYIDIPDGVTSIGHYAFSNCAALKNFAIPEGVEIIDWGTFESCWALEDVTIPASVTTVGKYAFSYCSALSRIHFTGSKAQRDALVVEDANGTLDMAVWHYAVTAGQDNTYTCPECGTYQPGVNPVPYPVSLTVKPITVRPYVDSYDGYDENGNEIQYYEWVDQVEYELTMSNGDVILGDSSSLYFNDTWYDPQFADHQGYGEIWLPGNTYAPTMSIMGITAEVPVTVAECPIESVTVLPITLYRDLDMHTHTAYDGNDNLYEYTRYYWTEDVTTVVTFKDGTTGTFGQTIYYGDLSYEMTLTDSQTHTDCWSAGRTYTETAYVAGFTCPVNITIEETAVEKVVADPLVLYEGGDGSWVHQWDSDIGDWVKYYCYDWQEFATYTIYFTDGTTCKAKGTSFEFNGHTYDLGYSYTQDDEVWTAGNTYRQFLVINDIRIYFDVTVQPTPVVSVVAENVTVEDRIHGKRLSSHNSAGEYVKYFHYDWTEKVRYTVTFGDGTVLECAGPDFTYRGRNYEIEISDEQGADNIWAVGQSYPVTLSAMGVSTELTVTVAENPVERVEVQPITLIENGTGMWESGRDADGNYVEYFYYTWTYALRYTVYFKNGTSVYSEGYFFPYDGRELSFTSSGYAGADNIWTPGNTYYPTLYLFDLQIEVPVTIVPGPVGKSFTLSFEDEILVNFYYQVPKTDDVVETGMAVFYEAPEGEFDLESADEIYENPVYDPETGRYMCQSKGIAAKQMGDTRYYVAYAKLMDECYVYSKAYDYSPRKYAMNMLGKASASEKQKKLCVAMLNYGAAAQTYFGYNADDLMNSALTAEQQAMVLGYDRSLFKGAAACDKATDFVKTEGFTKKSATVSFEGAFVINFYMTPANAAKTMTLYVWTPEVYRSADSLTAENAQVLPMTDNGGIYFAQVAGIAPKALDDTYYVAAVYTDADGSEYCSGIIAYSLSKYCLNHDSGNMAQLAQATAMYGYYAKAYFNA